MSEFLRSNCAVERLKKKGTHSHKKSKETSCWTLRHRLTSGYCEVMQAPNRRHRTRSAGTKLSEEQYAAVQAQADAGGLVFSEYVRHVLMSAPAQAAAIAGLQTLFRVQLEETVALRMIVINLAGALAKGEPVTPELLQSVRAHADGLKSARAQKLLSPEHGDDAEKAE